MPLRGAKGIFMPERPAFALVSDYSTLLLSSGTVYVYSTVE